MKNKKWILILFTAYTVCMSLSCKKDKLTKATQTGANTFSCKIDGVIFKPSESGGFFSGNPLIVNNWPIDGFTIRARKYKDDNNSVPRNVILKLSYLKTIGSYPLITYPYGQYEIDYSGGPVYRTDATHTGTVTITRCDTVNQIYSGTFSFTAIDKNTNNVVKVTDGRFDVKQ